MLLKLDTSNPELVKVTLGKKTHQTQARIATSQLLLPFIVSLLKEQNISIKDIKGVTFVPGPGSFTGIRVGASVALALAWSLGVPVNGHKATEKIKILYN